jgi:hypothetical protein
MTQEEIGKFVTPVDQMTNEELVREVDNLIQWEGEHGTAEPRIDELTMEILLRELMVDPDWVVGLELDEQDLAFVDAKPREEVSDEI